MELDTSPTIEIAGSPLKFWGLGLLGLIPTVLSIGIALPLFPGMPNTYLHIAVGWFGAVFFGAGTMLSVWRALTSAGPVLTLSPTGIRDVRVATEEIP